MQIQISMRAEDSIADYDGPFRFECWPETDFGGNQRPISKFRFA